MQASVTVDMHPALVALVLAVVCAVVWSLTREEQ